MAQTYYTTKYTRVQREYLHVTASQSEAKRFRKGLREDGIGYKARTHEDAEAIICTESPYGDGLRIVGGLL